MPSQNIVYILVKLNENNFKFTTDKDRIFSAAWSRKYRINLNNRNTTIFTANNYLLGYEPNCADEDHIFALYFKDDNKTKKILLAKGKDSKREEVFVITDKGYYFFNNEWQEEDFFREKNCFACNEVLNEISRYYYGYSYIHLTELRYLLDSDFAHYSEQKLPSTLIINDLRCPRKFFITNSDLIHISGNFEVLQLFLEDKDKEKIFMVDIYAEFIMDLQDFADYFMNLKIVDDTEKVQLFCLAIELILCGNSQFKNIDIKAITDKLSKFQSQKLLCKIYDHIQDFRERLYSPVIYENFKDIVKFKDLKLNMVFGYYVQILFYVLLKNKHYSLAQIKRLQNEIINVPLYASVQIQYSQHIYEKTINGTHTQQFIAYIANLIYQQIEKFNSKFKLTCFLYSSTCHDLSAYSFDILFKIFEIDHYRDKDINNIYGIINEVEIFFIEYKIYVANNVANKLYQLFEEENKFFIFRHLSKSEIQSLQFVLKNKKEYFISFAFDNFCVSEKIYAEELESINNFFEQLYASNNESFCISGIFCYKLLLSFLDEIINKKNRSVPCDNISNIKSIVVKIRNYSHIRYLDKLFQEIFLYLNRKENTSRLHECLLEEFNTKENMSYKSFYKLFDLAVSSFAFASQYKKFELFDIACKKSLLNIIRIMLQDDDITRKLNINIDVGDYDLFHRAVVIQNNIAVVQELLKSKNISKDEYLYHQLLEWCIKNKNYEMSMLLLNSKVLFSYKCMYSGKTDFIIAVEENFYDFVRAVLQMQHAITLNSSQMNEALAVAVKKEYTEMIKLFDEYHMNELENYLIKKNVEFFNPEKNDTPSSLNKTMRLI